MAAVVFPQEAVAEYVKRLLGIAGDTARDASTLARQARLLMGEGQHGRVMGVLRRYARDRQQSGANETRKIVDDMETFLDSKIVEQKKENEARIAERAKERREKDEKELEASWERGGDNFNHAVGELRADAHALIYMAKVIEDSGNDRVITAMSNWIYSAERGRLFAGLKEALDAAHGHEHNEDGSEITDEQKAAAQTEDAYAPNEGGVKTSKVLLIYAAVVTLLFVVVAQILWRKLKLIEV